MATLLFDLFGVIACPQSAVGRARIEELAGVEPGALWQAYWGERQDYDRGDIDGPAYWQRIAARLHRRFTPGCIARLIEADIASWSAVDQPMIELIGALAAGGNRLGLLSNVPPEHLSAFEPRHPWLSAFAVRAFSCRIRHAKPEPDAFRHCITALGRAPHEILFIDDSGRNVAAAEQLGLRGHVFTGRDALLSRLRG